LLNPSRVDSTFEKNRRVLQRVCLCYRLCSDVPCHGTRIDDGFYLCFCFCLNVFFCDHVAANRISIYVCILFLFKFLIRADRESNPGTTVLHGAPLIIFTSNCIHQVIMINVNHRSRTPTW
jgi:hypothetical protein